MAPAPGIAGVATPAQMFVAPAFLIQSWLEVAGKLMALQQQALIDILGPVSRDRGRRTF